MFCRGEGLFQGFLKDRVAVIRKDNVMGRILSVVQIELGEKLEVDIV
jgi:hypothetical protein